MGNEIEGCPYGVCNNFEKLGFAMIGERDTRLEMELVIYEPV